MVVDAMTLLTTLLWISPYQDGVRASFLPFLVVLDVRVGDLDRFHDVVAPWLESLPSLELVGALLDELEELRPVMTVYAVVYRRVDVLGAFPFLLRENHGVNLLDTAALHGHLDVVEFLHGQNAIPTYAAMNWAAGHGHLDIVQFLHTNRREGCTKIAMDTAAENGHLDVVKFLHEHRTEGCSTYAMTKAAENGHLQVVEFLHKHRQEGCEPTTLDEAARRGHLAVVRYLHAHTDLSATTYAMDEAARYRHMDVLHFLAEHRDEGCSPDAIDWAATNGFLDVVIFLDEKYNAGCTSKALDGAAANGHLDVVKFLIPKYASNSSSSMLVRAAEGGHLRVIKFVLEHATFSGGWATSALEAASRHGHTEVVSFLLSKFRFRGINAAMYEAASHGHLTVLRMLETEKIRGVTTLALVCASGNGHGQVVRYLVENYVWRRSQNSDILQRREDSDPPNDDFSSVPCMESAVDEAAMNGHVGIAEYLHRISGAKCSRWAMLESLRQGNVAMVHSIQQMGITLKPSDLIDAVSANQLGSVKCILEHVPHCELDLVKGIKIAQAHGYRRITRLLKRLDSQVAYSTDLKSRPS